MRVDPEHVVARASAPHPCCEACGAPYLAWQPELRCVLWRCPRCGFIARDLDLAPGAARSAEYGGDPAADRVRLAITLHRARRRLGSALRGRVLEIGAGTGALSAALARRCDEVVAVERLPLPWSDAAVAAGVTRVTGRWEDVDLPDGSLDVIVAVHVLEHVEDLVAGLRRARELLAPGGVLYALTPSADCAALRLFGSAWWMLEDPTHVRFLSRASVAPLAHRAGFAAWRARSLVLDSMAADAATLARAAGTRGGDDGVLALPGVKLASAAGLVASLPLRYLWPRWRPVLEVEMKAP